MLDKCSTLSVITTGTLLDTLYMYGNCDNENVDASTNLTEFSQRCLCKAGYRCKIVYL